MDVNDDACFLDKRGAIEFIASKRNVTRLTPARGRWKT